MEVYNNEKLIFSEKINYLRYLWSYNSLEMEKSQNSEECVEQEKKFLLNSGKLSYSLNHNIYERLNLMETNFVSERFKKIAVLRDEGSNGDREMRLHFSVLVLMFMI